jgi:hypothetical protein
MRQQIQCPRCGATIEAHWQLFAHVTCQPIGRPGTDLSARQRGWPQGLLMLVAVLGALLAKAVLTGNFDRILSKSRRGDLLNIRERSLPGSIGAMALVLGACLLALLINPYGFELITFPLTMQQGWIRHMTEGTEWQSPWANPGWRKVGGGWWVNVEPLFWLYWGAAGGLVLRALGRWRTADLVPVAVMALWLGLNAWHLRAVSDAVLLTSPFVAAGVSADGSVANFDFGATSPNRVSTIQ